MSRILSSLADGVLTLTLNRPDKRNALDGGTVTELYAGLESAALDAQVRVVVLRGAGRDFCAGADLAELLASRDRAAGENERDALRLGEVFLAIRRLEKPVAAVVQGRALAGGCGLATACDLVIAADSAQFGYPEVQRGFVPAMVLALLRRQVGEKVAFDLAATSRLLGAEEARALGLVSRVVPAARLDQEAAALLAPLTGASATALALTKRLLHDLDGPSIEEGIRLGARVNALARSTPDFRAAVERFLS
ncbi:MAG TPA: enoyl-CoA hydratase/isomerase family protein [Gemmatimonadales bacterium]|nr:enoyl-CoA hydratase/isomerase family protein [Gemmatimonadales bacterium]